MSALGAVILAAGGSTRMGRAKPLLELDGATLVSRSVSAARGGGCDPVVVVIGSTATSMRTELQSHNVQVVENADWSLGMGGSIRRGVSALLDARPDVARIVLLLCDQPLVSADTIRRLDAQQQASGKPVCVSAYAGTVGPPVVVSGSFLESLRTLPDAHGAKSIWVDHAESVSEMECPEGAIDVDTPDDFAGVVEALR